MIEKAQEYINNGKKQVVSQDVKAEVEALSPVIQPYVESIVKSEHNSVGEANGRTNF